VGVACECDIDPVDPFFNKPTPIDFYFFYYILSIDIFI